LDNYSYEEREIKMKTFRYIVMPAIALLLAMNIYVFFYKGFIEPEIDESSEIKSSGEALVVGSFTLTDQNGNKVSDSDFKGKNMLVYFGFTNCPMICPTDMANLTQVLEELGEDAKKIQPVFITIDPQRDTPEQIKTFLSNFYPTFVGLTGTPREIADVANKYRIYYKQVEAEDLQEYTMDHSAYTYLMGKDGKYLAHFRHEQPIEEVVRRISQRIN